MIHHLLKLIWNQRKQNIWIVAELFLVFILLWYIVDYFFILNYNASIPKGYNIQNTYLIQLSTIPEKNPAYDTSLPENPDLILENYLTLLDRIENHPDIQYMCISNMSIPYSPNNRDNSFSYEGKTVFAQMLEVSPSYFDVYQITSEDGINIQQLKTTLAENNIIITPQVAKLLFNDENPVGKFIHHTDLPDIQWRVGGVSAPRKWYDYARIGKCWYTLLAIEKLKNWNETSLTNLEISIRIKSNVNSKEFPEKFKQEMNNQLAIGNFILSDIVPLSDIQQHLNLTFGFTDNIRYRIGIMIFLLISIFLGIIGTFWFRNEYRKSEIGLRIALGTSQKQVLQMIITEGWLFLNIILIPAIIVCINMAFLEMLDTEYMDITFLRVGSGILFTYVLLCGIIFLGSWYPAWLASKTAPAETLRTE